MLRKIINLKRLDEPFNKTFFLLSLINPKPLEKKPFWTDRTPFEPPKSRKFCMFYIKFCVITRCSGNLRRPLSRQPLESDWDIYFTVHQKKFWVSISRTYFSATSLNFEKLSRSQFVTFLQFWSTGVFRFSWLFSCGKWRPFDLVWFEKGKFLREFGFCLKNAGWHSQKESYQIFHWSGSIFGSPNRCLKLSPPPPPLNSSNFLNFNFSQHKIWKKKCYFVIRCSPSY